jgi:protein-tyrosine-phosphatase
MAEYLCRTALDDSSAWRVVSAGVSAAPGIAASSLAVKVLDELSIDLRPHRSQPATQEWMQQTDIVVVMAGTHRHQLNRLYPDAAEKVFLLSSFSHDFEGDVVDPIGMTEDVYRRIRDMIREALPDLIDFLNNLE